ncbi:MAG TPA: hypothetical protein DCQ50_15900 [Chryseobacterium sp.]|nr:hypothetical protein [Chryseobacterium sp.]
MENSEQQKKIINLGKLFVKELQLDPGVDTLSRWMAHYVAEKISYTESSTGTAQLEAKKECFEVILELWKHRHFLPRERRPLHNFESIIETLAKLDPEIEEPYFYTALRGDETPEFTTDHLDEKSVEKLLDIAKEIDKTARIWIDYLLKTAADKAMDKNTKEWLENAVELDDKADVEIIMALVDKGAFQYNEGNNEEFLKNYEIKRLQKRITQLKKYFELNKIILANYENDLNNIL